ncbi:hypothetical protein ES288_D09G168800v1 [Gossypium darwinii]|uniref:Uncharacterized protein n=1 Tax=Gossypium darwinii TaxID=34276 RepID=A0A5D2BCE2_GOSDA|nr:hypothetical protein ES288_D09G168800v1 [Gossypium darwinii]
MASRLFATGRRENRAGGVKAASAVLTQAAALEFVTFFNSSIDYSLIGKENSMNLLRTRGVKIPIDPKALMHVIGTKIVFDDDKLRSEFVFINPNSKGKRGYGKSFMTTAGVSDSRELLKFPLTDCTSIGST